MPIPLARPRPLRPLPWTPPADRPRGSHPRTEQGLALILVLWMLSLLAGIAGSFVFSTRAEAVLAANLVALAKAAALADGGIHRAIQALSTGQWAADGRPRLWTPAEGEVRLRIRDEAGKIDLNRASDPLLRGALFQAGLEWRTVATLLDRIADWRDADELPRLYGAEAEDYRLAGRDDIPDNAPFRSVAELRRVLGVDEALFARLEKLFTVHSGQPGIHSAAAAPEVLRALPGIDPLVLHNYLARRDAAPGPLLPLLPGAQAFESGPSEVFGIEAEARVDGAVFVREAVVRLIADPQRPVTFLAWRTPPARGRPGGEDAS